jgi:acyl-CoA thioesterase I
LTIGKGVNITDSYPSVLADLSGRKVINAGITGEETSKGLLRLESILKEIKPDLVILLEGGNDILNDKDLTITKSNLSKMIELIQNNKIPVVLIGVPDKTLTANSSEIYKEISDKYNLILEESIIKNLLINPEYKSDDHHFNKKGYHLLAESIYKIIKEAGAL